MCAVDTLVGEDFGDADGGGDGEGEGTGDGDGSVTAGLGATGWTLGGACVAAAAFCG